MPSPRIVHLAYGQGHLPVRLPAGAVPTVIRKRPLPKLEDPHAAVRDALERPVGAPPLRDLARGRRSACILVCDITRPVPNRLFLRPMIEALVAGGVPRDAVTVLVATGLHRPNEGEELRELIGDRFARLEAVPGGFVVVLDVDGQQVRHVDVDAERAYARALLALRA